MGITWERKAANTEQRRECLKQDLGRNILR